jgi:hypothetical protein
VPVIPESHGARRVPPRGWRAHLRRVALGTAAIFLLLTLSAGALHRHGPSSSLHRIDCQACAWAHSATGALSHAAPAITVFSARLASHVPNAVTPPPCAASSHHGRAPPSSLV